MIYRTWRRWFMKKFDSSKIEVKMDLINVAVEDRFM